MSTHKGFTSAAPSTSGNSQALLLRAQAGDKHALTELFELYRERILRIARIRIGPQLAIKLDPEDIVQETLCVAWDKLDSFEARDAPRLIDWFARIAQNCIHDHVKHWRSAKRANHKEISIRTQGMDGRPSTLLPISGGSGTPSQLVSAREMQDIYDASLAELPEHYREVILLKQYEDMSWTEIAEEIGSPNAKAAIQLHIRAVAALDVILKANGFDVPTSSH
jgi:RNA polymerase sigma-70 factor, ECF subfamily